MNWDIAGEDTFQNRRIWDTAFKRRPKKCLGLSKVTLQAFICHNIVCVDVRYMHVWSASSIGAAQLSASTVYHFVEHSVLCPSPPTHLWGPPEIEKCAQRHFVTSAHSRHFVEQVRVREAGGQGWERVFMIVGVTKRAIFNTFFRAKGHTFKVFARYACASICMYMYDYLCPCNL